MTTMSTMYIVHKWAPHAPREAWVSLEKALAAKWTKPVKCHKPRSQDSSNKQWLCLSRSLLHRCRRDPSSPWPHPSQKYRWWTTRTKRIIFVCWCAVLRSQRPRTTSPSLPPQPYLPTARTTSSKRKLKRWSPIAIRRSISSVLLSLTTLMNSWRWRVTCDWSENLAFE